MFSHNEFLVLFNRDICHNTIEIPIEIFIKNLKTNNFISQPGNFWLKNFWILNNICTYVVIHNVAFVPHYWQKHWWYTVHSCWKHSLQQEQWRRHQHVCCSSLLFYHWPITVACIQTHAYVAYKRIHSYPLIIAAVVLVVVVPLLFSLLLPFGDLLEVCLGKIWAFWSVHIWRKQNVLEIPYIHTYVRVGFCLSSMICATFV